MTRERIYQLRKKFKDYEIDGYIIPKNDEFFSEYAQKDRLKTISNFTGSAGFAVILKKKCQEIEIKKDDIKFKYRGSNLSEDFIILSAKLKGILSKKEIINKKQADYIERKKLSQPSQIKTCGSTFKNISKELKAWMLIKKAGCDKLSEGEAEISEKHCNFFVNKGNAKSSDIEKLITKVKKKVYEKTKVNLELEIKIIGE